MADEQETSLTTNASEAVRELSEGERRAASLRVLSAWFNITVLNVMAWPLIVVAFDAPLDPPAELPLGWFLVYMVPAAAVLVLTARLWRVNQLSLESLGWRPALAMYRRGGWQGQLALVLATLTLVTTVLLLVAKPLEGVQALLSGVARALAVQLLIAGYVRSMLAQFGADPSRVYWFGVGMFTLTIAAETAIAVAARQNPGVNELMLAFSAGALLGVLLGMASMSLRGRTGSLIPALLLQLLLFSLIPQFL